MTPERFKTIRLALGLTAQGLADVLQIADGRTVRRWEAADRAIPGPVKLLMFLLERGLVSKRQLRVIKEPLDN